MSSFTFGLNIKKFVEPELQMYPETPAIHLIARDPNAKRKTNTLSVNMKAMADLAINENNNEISFITDNESTETYFFFNQNKKTYDCPSHNFNSNHILRNKQVYEYLITKFSLNTIEDNYIGLVKTKITVGDKEIEVYHLANVLGKRVREALMATEPAEQVELNTD